MHLNIRKTCTYSERYKYRGGADHVLAEITVISQRPGESAGDFGERVEALLNKLRKRNGYIKRKLTKRQVSRIPYANESAKPDCLVTNRSQVKRKLIKT